MDYIAQFIAYASAFERAVETDEWEAVAACFAEHAVYEVPFDPPLGGRFVGRQAIVTYLEDILNRLDRCFATRKPELLGLTPNGNRIQIRGRVRYSHPDAPDLVFELDELAEFDGPLIVRLEDRYDQANRTALLSYIETWGERLGVRAT